MCVPTVGWGHLSPGWLLSSPHRRTSRSPAGMGTGHPLPRKTGRHTPGLSAQTRPRAGSSEVGATQNRPPTSVVRVRPAASGATEREGTPWPGVLVTVPSSSGGPRDRAHPVLPLWGVFPEAASPTQTPAVGVLVPSHLPRGIRKKPASLRRWRGFCGPVLGFGCDVQKKQEETVTPEAVSCPHGALWW